MRQETLRRMISFVLLVILLIVFGTTSSSFFTVNNIMTLLREASVVGMLAVGVTMCIITGGNDLSCGALLGLVSMVVAHLYHYTALPLMAILLIALAVALLGGMLNGICVAVLQIPDFVATLSTKMIFTGLILVFAIRNSAGLITTETINNPSISALGGAFPGGLYYSVAAFFLLAILAQFYLKRTKSGTYLYAMGSNRKSAEYSGISFVKVKMTAFMISAFCAYIGALFLLGRNRAAETATGMGFEFQAISATVIGGCAFAGGRGDMIGTVIGVLFMQVLKNGIMKYNFSTQTQAVVSGVVIVVMLVFDAFYNDYMQKKTTRAAAIAREKKAVAE
ncbi:MAG: ABC transporter permease [Lachnospiraceae bacterium]|nr:ABC transporter permease [Lachnospiraceae bacterium]